MQDDKPPQGPLGPQGRRSRAGAVSAAGARVRSRHIRGWSSMGNLRMRPGPSFYSAAAHHVRYPPLDSVARLAGFLLNAIDDLVWVVARFVYVLVRELVELIDEPSLQLWRSRICCLSMSSRPILNLPRHPLTQQTFAVMRSSKRPRGLSTAKEAGHLVVSPQRARCRRVVHGSISRSV